MYTKWKKCNRPKAYVISKGVRKYFEMTAQMFKMSVILSIVILEILIGIACVIIKEYIKRRKK